MRRIIYFNNSYVRFEIRYSGRCLKDLAGIVMKSKDGQQRIRAGDRTPERVKVQRIKMLNQPNLRATEIGVNLKLFPERNRRQE